MTRNNIFCILALLALAVSQAQAFPIIFEYHATAASPPNMHDEKVPIKFAQILCFVWRLIELICVILLVVDVISRMSGKALYFVHAARYIIFCFGFSALIYGGGKFADKGTRGYMTVHLMEFLDDMYANYLTWRLPSHVEIFNDIEPSTATGTTTVSIGGFMFMNVVFFEQCILLLLMLIWGIMKVAMGNGAMMSKVYHLVKSLFLIFFISFMFPLVFFGGIFWRQQANLKHNSNKPNNDFAYILNGVFMIFLFCVSPMQFRG